MKFLEFRVFEGVNIYSYSPVIKLTVDLQDLTEVTTDQPAGFVDRLLGVVPSLRDHHCSLGRPGGLVERMKAGTYFGHLLEHLILELQHLAGANVIYGKTRKGNSPGVYEVVYEYESVGGGIQAAKSACSIIKALLNNEKVSLATELEATKQAGLKTGLGPSTKAIADEATRRKIPVMRLGEGSILQLGYGCYQRRVEATITDATSCVGVDIAGDKILTKQLLSEAGIPVPWGGAARTEQEALDLAKSINESVVVKPYDGNQGKGVALNLTSKEQVKKAFSMAMNYCDRVIVEKYITGKQYRLLVVDDRLVAASERLPATVRGDGRNTIEELIAQANEDPLRGEGHEKPLTKIKVDPVMIMVLQKQGHKLSSVPAKGEKVMLRENANLSTGGVAVDVTDLVHPENAVLAVKAAKLIGLDVAGIDLVAEDISIPLQSGCGAVIEVNAAPGIRMHHYPAQGKSRNVARAIVNKLFPKGAKSRIPIAAVTGTNGKTTTTRLIGHVLQGTGKVVGMTTSDGIYINGKNVLKGDTTGPASAKTVLRDNTVDAAVLETARGGIIRAGLGFDYCDVAVITNISEDHLGVDGIECLEDLAYVKSLVAETAHKEGYVVLNADDLLVAGMANRCRGRIIYFSSVADNITVRRHLGAGGLAVFIKNGFVVCANGSRAAKIVSVKDIPCALAGKARHNVENVLAATAACVGLEVSVDQIREGLLSFTLGLKTNPGRLNIFDASGVKVLVDYGHNLAGYECTIAVARSMKPRKLIGVIGVPGDRLDQSIVRVGEAAGCGLDFVIIKEDSDLRGRRPGEVAGLLKNGVEKSGLSKDNINITLKETTAILKALEMAEPGDLVVIFYEKLEPVINMINTFGELNKVKQAKKPSTGQVRKKATV